MRHGRYRPASMPRSTEYRIHQRVMALRAAAAELSAKNAGSFWQAFDGLAG